VCVSVQNSFIVLGDDAPARGGKRRKYKKRGRKQQQRVDATSSKPVNAAAEQCETDPISVAPHYHISSMAPNSGSNTSRPISPRPLSPRRRRPLSPLRRLSSPVIAATSATIQVIDSDEDEKDSEDDDDEDSEDED